MNELKHNASYHNLTHKYLIWISISICGNYDKSSVKLSSRPYFWVGAEVEKFGRLFSIRKTCFLQVKRLILVGTLEKCAFLSLLILKSYSTCG